MKKQRKTRMEQAAPYDAADAALQGGEPAPVSMASARAKVARQRRRTNGLYKFLALVALLCVGIVVVQQTMFRLHAVYVIGNKSKSAQQVVTASGLYEGQNMLSFDEADVAAAMAKDHTIVFEGMEKQYPSTVYLRIRERTVTATMQWLGMLYTLDKEGMVMTEENSSILPPGLPVVNGLQTNSVLVGHTLTLKTPGQLEAFCTIMEELYQQMYVDQVSEINLADPGNIFLVTAEGVNVRLGDSTYMRAKIGAVRTCMGSLRQMGNLAGVLDVTTPEEPKYMP